MSIHSPEAEDLGVQLWDACVFISQWRILLCADPTPGGVRALMQPRPLILSLPRYTYSLFI